MRIHYTRELSEKCKPIFKQGFRYIYSHTKQITKLNKHLLRNFQEALEKVPRWNSMIITKEFDRFKINSNCLWIDKLIRASFVAEFQVANNSKNEVKLDVPKSQDFIHMVYIEIARELWKKPQLLFEGYPNDVRKSNDLEFEAIIDAKITLVIKNMLPLESLVNSYLKDAEEQYEYLSDDDEKMSFNGGDLEFESTDDEDDEDDEDAEDMNEDVLEQEEVVERDDDASQNDDSNSIDSTIVELNLKSKSEDYVEEKIPAIEMESSRDGSNFDDSVINDDYVTVEAGDWNEKELEIKPMETKEILINADTENNVETNKINGTDAVELTTIDTNTVESTSVDDTNTVESTSVDDTNMVESTTVDDTNTVESTTVDDANTVESTTVDDANTVELTDQVKKVETFNNENHLATMVELKVSKSDDQNNNIKIVSTDNSDKMKKKKENADKIYKFLGKNINYKSIIERPNEMRKLLLKS